jgi:hypothetical protein
MKESVSASKSPRRIIVRADCPEAVGAWVGRLVDGDTDWDVVAGRGLANRQKMIGERRSGDRNRGQSGRRARRVRHGRGAVAWLRDRTPAERGAHSE